MPILPSSPAGRPSPAIGRLDVLLERAKQAAQAGRRDDAMRLYEKILTIDAMNAEVRNALGMAYGEAGDLGRAIEQFDNSLRIDPNQPVTWQNRGLALSRAGHMLEAIACFDRVIALRPDLVAGYVLRANSLFFLGRFEDAVAAYDQLLPLLPNDAAIATNRGAALQWCRRLDDAFAEYDRAISLDPNHALAQGNKGILLMTLGDLTRGLPLYAWRWKIFPPDHARPMAQKPWLGETAIAGKTLFVYPEQGLGDVIQASRYIKIAAEAGARVILETRKPLFELMKTLDGVAELLPEGAPTPEYQCAVPDHEPAFGVSHDVGNDSG